MQVAELKKILQKQIHETENELLLEEVYQLLKGENGQVFPLNEDQINTINIARDEMAEGKYLSNEEANKRVNQWLKE